MSLSTEEKYKIVFIFISYVFIYKKIYKLIVTCMFVVLIRAKKKNLKIGQKHLFFNGKRKKIEQTSVAL